jgi:hypothetical protein
MKQIPVKSKKLPELQQISKLFYTAGAINLKEIAGLSTAVITINPEVEIPKGFRFRFGLNVDPAKVLILLGVSVSDSGSANIYILNPMRDAVRFKDDETIVYAELEEVLYMKVINNINNGVVILDQPQQKLTKNPVRRSNKKP